MPPVDFQNITQEGKTLNKEMRERTLGFITGGLGLVAGLAWNDAIKALIEYLFPLGKDSIPAKFVYAILISVIVVALSVYLVRLLKTEDEKPLTR